MRNYEAAFFLLPGLEEDAVKTLSDKFSTQINQWGGEITKLTNQGKKRFAYNVKGHEEGYFIVVEFKGEPNVAKELDRVLRISDEVLRSIIVHLN